MKKKIFIAFLVCLIAVPVIYFCVSYLTKNNDKNANNDNETVVRYTITFDYDGTEVFFDNAKDSVTIRSTEWLKDNIPTIKAEYKGCFIGWYYKTEGSNKENEINEQGNLTGNITAYPKFMRYIVRFDYGIAKEYFDTTPDIVFANDEGKITNRPTIKNEYEDAFLGWYSSETKMCVTSILNGDITLYAKFDVASGKAMSGLYQDGKYVKTWERLKEDYSAMFKSTEIVSDSESISKISGELVIDSSITKIGANAFANSELTSIYIPKEVIDIDESMTMNCSDLSRIVVSADNAKYDSRNDCNAVIETSANKLIVGCKYTLIPNTVTKIGSKAFVGSGITNLKISSGVIEIPVEAFYNCKLKYISVDSGNTKYDSRNFCYAIIETSTNKLILGCQNTTIPEGVQSIGEEAFVYACELTSIVIPEGVQYIDRDAFCGCSDLTSVVLPTSLINISYGAFSDCTKLYNVFYLGNESQLKNYDFDFASESICVKYYYEMLTETMLGENLENYWHYVDDVPTIWNVEGKTFYSITFDYGKAKSVFDNARDSALLEATECTEWLKDNMPTIKAEYKDAFLGWYNAETNTKYETSTAISKDTTLYAKFDVANEKAMSGLYQNGKYIKTWATLKQEYPDMFQASQIYIDTEEIEELLSYSTGLAGELVVDSSITRICDYSLGFNDLTSIFIPSSVNQIGCGVTAFDDKLTRIVISSNNSIYDCRNNCDAIIETSTNKLVAGCKNTIIPNTVTSIGSYAYYGLKITSINTNNVETINSYAFAYSDLKSIWIYKDVVDIKSKAFAYCNSLEIINVASGNTKYENRGSQAIIEKATDKLIVGCKDTVIPTTVKIIGDSAFYGCSMLTTINIPSSVTNIEDYAFAYSGLAIINLSEGVEKIGYNAFYGSSLTSIFIPASVTFIGNYAFANCPKLMTIEVASENIKYDSRNNCNGIVEISTDKLIVGCKNTKLSVSVTSISIGAFYECADLVEILIPHNIESIGTDAFYGCDKLSVVFYDGTETEWNAISIGNNSNVLSSCVKFYSNTIPTKNIGNYWHYVKGVPTIWSE